MITKDSFLHIVRGGLGQTKCLSLGRTERERDMRVGRYGTNSKPKNKKEAQMGNGVKNQKPTKKKA